MPLLRCEVRAWKQGMKSSGENRWPETENYFRMNLSSRYDQREADMYDVMDSIQEELTVSRIFEPPTAGLPKWVVEDFEKRGGRFAGKVEHPDGTVTITGIVRFSNDYAHDVEAHVRRQAETGS